MPATKIPATKNSEAGNREAGILPRFGGRHHFSGVKRPHQPAVAMDGTAGVKTERAKGLEPSTCGLGKSRSPTARANENAVFLDGSQQIECSGCRAD